ncbi:hypothetical protein C8R43DRAFT_1141083 [Mycena crocata]|nr:hypothetical protein C8R43DRAFT_1141083 [Mycena crocata]
MTDLNAAVSAASPPAPAAPSPLASFRALPLAIEQSNLLSALVALTSVVDAVAGAAAAVGDAPLSHVIGALADLAAASNGVNDAAAAMSVAAAPFLPMPSAPASNPAPLQGPMFRNSAPWVAGALYTVVPKEPLVAVPDNNEKWFAITRGKYVGLTKNSAISLNAVTGISTALSDKFNTQNEALDHFNDALSTPGAIAILR